MSRAASEFVTPLTFQTLSNHAVATELFDLTQESEIGHIQLAEWAELMIVAPATADLVARLAAGMGDVLLTTMALVVRAPILLAPAMNTLMWEHEFVQSNVAKLTGLGRYFVVGPGSGFLACKVVGPGRLAEPADIVEAAGGLMTAADQRGKRVLVTAGPTHEAIDPVRFIANRSSGKMGYAIARAAAARGAEVTLVTGPTSLPEPLGVEVIRVGSAAELGDATTMRAAGADVLVMSAAVADFSLAKIAGGKLKKDDFGAAPSLELKRNRDVLADLARARRERPERRQVLVGFAAETEKLEQHARAKLAAKGCDLIVANDVSQSDAGFEVDTNRVTIVGPGDKLAPLPLLSKDEVAHQVLDAAKSLL
jgi:phosphopantothenoylcysteine decarboxylase/phosphopantothenate--cysteine ligase